MKLYVGMYRKYNEGSIFGEWLELDDYSSDEEFLDACYKIHCDEHDPELMFQDFEADADWEELLYCEYYSPSEYWKIKKEQNLDVDDEVFSAFISVC